MAKGETHKTVHLRSGEAEGGKAGIKMERPAEHRQGRSRPASGMSQTLHGGPASPVSELQPFHQDTTA